MVEFVRKSSFTHPRQLTDPAISFTSHTKCKRPEEILVSFIKIASAQRLWRIPVTNSIHNQTDAKVKQAMFRAICSAISHGDFVTQETLCESGLMTQQRFLEGFEAIIPAAKWILAMEQAEDEKNGQNELESQEDESEAKEAEQKDEYDEKEVHSGNKRRSDELITSGDIKDSSTSNKRARDK